MTLITVGIVLRISWMSMGVFDGFLAPKWRRKASGSSGNQEITYEDYFQVKSESKAGDDLINSYFPSN
jgi:hypothetical protein